MQAVDEHGQPVDERGQPLHNANSNNYGNVAPLPCVPLKAFFLHNTTLEEYLALGQCKQGAATYIDQGAVSAVLRARSGWSGVV